MEFDMKRKMTDDTLKEFAEMLMSFQSTIDFKLSARGWAYQLESNLIITKDEIDKAENLVNICRRDKHFLPVDFTAKEEARRFSVVEIPSTQTPLQHLKRELYYILSCGNIYSVDWWDDEEYYVQMVVESIDMKSLFLPVCKTHHIPISSGKGWQSIYQRAEYTRRFKEAEERGLKCVLLYSGDHDPTGINISNKLMKNITDLRNIFWADGTKGYDPKNLIIDRFALNYDYIIANNLTWVLDLKTSRKKPPNDLSDPMHPDHNKEYVQTYIKKYGVRKCEAEAIIKNTENARKLCKKTVEKYLGADAKQRFAQKRENVKEKIKSFLKDTGIHSTIADAIKLMGLKGIKIKEEEEED